MEKNLVRKAAGGDSRSFEVLVGLYQPRLYGFVRTGVNNRQDIEEIVQDTFVQCFLNLNKLREPESFSIWLFRICRNRMNQYYRTRVPDHQILQADENTLAEEKGEEGQWSDYIGLVESSLSVLPERQREVVNLKYFGKCSYREISILCGIGEKLVKSRLFEARKKLKDILPDLHSSGDLPESVLTENRRKIMQRKELIEKSAFVMRAMSLGDQMHLCGLIAEGKKFDDRILKVLGELKFGKDVAAACESGLTIEDFADVAVFDRELEKWLIGNLEESDPELAGRLKAGTFVFEDLLLLGQDVTAELVGNTDPVLLMTAVSACEPAVKKYMLSFLTEEIRQDLLAGFPEINTTGKVIESAQYDIIENLKSITGPCSLMASVSGDLKAVLDHNLASRGCL